MNLAHLLVRTARAFPDRPAMAVGEHVVYDYRELARRAAGVAMALRTTLELSIGARVALFARNRAEYLEIMHGAWMAGLAVVPVNNKLHPSELRFILEDSGAEALFVSRDVANGLDALSGLPSLRHILAIDGAEYARLREHHAAQVHDSAPDDVAWLFYTSGTTGRPKGVMLTHRNLLAMTLCYFADVDQARRTDSAIYAAPLSHGAGLYNLPNMLAGARHVIPESGGFDAAEFFALAQAHGEATAFAAPTMVKRLVDHAQAHGARADAIKTIVYGGGPMYLTDILRALDVLGNRFVQIYGQGESPMTITALSRAHHMDREHPDHEARLASVGIAQSAVEVRVVDHDGRALAPGASGEIIVRGDTVMRGYWGNAEATASTLRDGWLYTGDVGALDDHGFLTLKDRSKDVIISGGANIYPREVEEVLLRHPDIAEVCVVGRAHAEWGEEAVAFIVRRPGKAVDEAQLDALCLAHIARFKRPRAYYFVPSLPKNNYGKLLKREVREWLTRGAPEL